MLNLSVIVASLGKVPPKLTPACLVYTSPVLLRISEGADIFGSKNSMCEGPPCKKRNTTDLSRITPAGRAAWAAEASNPGNANPPQAAAPYRRKSRRLMAVLDCEILEPDGALRLGILGAQFLR